MDKEKNKNTNLLYNRQNDINNRQDGTLFANLNGYNILEFRNNSYNYFLAIPSQYNDVYQLFVGFPKRDFTYSSKNDIILEIDNIKKMIGAINKDGVYVLPNIPLNDLEDAALENDNKKFTHILNNYIKPIVSDVYLQLKSFDNANKTIDQLIYFVKQSESDTKFIQWLEINLPNFVNGISYEELKNYYYANVDNEKEADLDKTMVIPREKLFQDLTKEKEVNTKTNNKKRILVRPDTNRYGFGNITEIMIILSIITILSLISFNLIIK